MRETVTLDEYESVADWVFSYDPAYDSVTVNTTPERRETVNDYATLDLVARYLAKTGVEIAQDFQVHYNCQLESNCTEAIKLRKMITEAGLDVATVIKETGEDYVKMNTRPEPLSVANFPDFSGKASIMVGGQVVELDLKEELENQLRHYFHGQLDVFRSNRDRIVHMGEDLYHNYLSAIREVKRTMSLPQCQIHARELLLYDCTIAYGDANSYLFIFPVRYSPQWVVTDEKRYSLCEKDIQALDKKGIFAMFQILRDNKLIRPRLVHRNLSKFKHYHGDGEDCWGALQFPKLWDGVLKTLADLNYTVESALCTINRDSPVLIKPSGMPSLIDLFDRATLEGKEGVRKKETPAEPHPPDRQGQATADAAINVDTATIDAFIAHWGGGTANA